MEEILKRLLARLEEIGSTNEELYDSDVRQQIRNAIMDGFVRGQPNYAIPDDFKMFTAQANLAVKDAVVEYISAASQMATVYGLARFHERLTALQDHRVRTSTGQDYEEFIGHSNSEQYDEAGHVIRR
jgi:hypothetical protein